MGSDGLFDKQSNSDIVQTVFKKAIEVYNIETKNIDRVASVCAQAVAKEAIERKALDNISCNVILFDNFINFLNGIPVRSENKTREGVFPQKHNFHTTNPRTTMTAYANYDLTDKDIDKSHSSKSIDYLLTNLKKLNIAREGQHLIDKYTNKNSSPSQGLFSKTPNK